MQTIRKTAGAYLREWRGKRRVSQLELANEAEISARHLSFLETGRSQPSREVLLRLSEQLDIPLRERNVILLAAGYAPVFEERPACISRNGRGATGSRARVEGPRAVSRARGRPALAARVHQCERCAAACRS